MRKQAVLLDSAGLLLLLATQLQLLARQLGSHLVCRLTQQATVALRLEELLCHALVIRGIKVKVAAALAVHVDGGGHQVISGFRLGFS